MSTTELEEVLTLLERILPDPAGFGERLVQQAVLQWAGGPRQHPVVAGTTSDSRQAGLLGQVLRADRHPAEPTEEPLADQHLADEPGADEPGDPPGLPTLLAFALGACDCWGQHPRCGVCAGAGGPGWAHPDPELFQEYVAPAAARLSAAWDEGTGDATRPRSDDHEPPREGAEP